MSSSKMARGAEPASAEHHLLNPYATLGQLSMAPATHTTVVTTTTTTTTSYPPIVVNGPRHLKARDPKEYPLAHVPPPESIRRFCFSAGDSQAFFEEADDVGMKLHEHKALHGGLQDSDGKLQTVKSYKGPPSFATPSRIIQPSRTVTEATEGSAHNRKRRELSPAPSYPTVPPSIAEAAELASLHRRSKKPKFSLHQDQRTRGSARLSANFTPEDMEDAVPATPDTDAGGSGSFKVPRSKASPRRPGLTTATHSSGRQQLPSGWQQRHGLSGSEPAESPGPSSSRGRGSLTGSIVEPGIAATPPIVETDMEPIGPFVADDVPLPQDGRPTPINTVAAQGVSLPSPSLSPITAAANLAQTANADTSFLMDNMDDDSNDVSSLDISQHSSLGIRDMDTMRSPSRFKRIELPDAQDLNMSNPQLPTPSIMDIPTMVESFDALPDKMKTWVMYHMLRRCTKSTLQRVADVVNPALKCDFLDLLPLECSLLVIKYLDVQSMCNAAQVSRRWRHIIDTDEGAWRNLLEKDGYALPDGELERAVKEGWGWQYPHSSESYERDLRHSFQGSKSDSEVSTTGASNTGCPVGSPDNDGASLRSASGRLKRKSTMKHVPSKKQRKKGVSSSKTQASSFSRSALLQQQGPHAIADIAAASIPSPNIGLPSLRSMHLYKSLYQRHHLIRKSWMEEDTRPKHIAFRAHQRHVVTCLQFDTDKILTGSDDTNINVYDTKTGALRSRLEGHEGGVWALQYEGNTLVSGSTDRSVRVWDIEKGKCTQVFQGHTSTVRCLVILKPTMIGETADGEPIMMPKEPLIITGSRDSTLRVWTLPKMGAASVFQTGGSTQNDLDNPYFIRALTGHHHSVRAIAAHGDTLVSGSYDCTVRVWKISTGDVLHRLQGHSQKVYSVVLDYARNRCISGSMDNLVKVWGLDHGQCLYTLEGHTSLVGLLDLSHQRLVSAAADSTLRIWDPENGLCKSTLCAHTGAITCFQHDGQKVISGSDKTLKMWNVKTGEFVKDLLTDLSGVWQVKFNERRCVAAVQRNNMTYIEVLDFGASRDGVPADQRGRRIVVNSKGYETDDMEDMGEIEAV